MVKILGRHPSGSRRDRIEKAANYTNGAFQNVEPTTVMAKEASFFKLLRELYVRPKEVSPLRPLPHLKTNLNGLSGDKPAVVWFGHSSYPHSVAGIYRVSGSCVKQQRLARSFFRESVWGNLGVSPR